MALTSKDIIIIIIGSIMGIFIAIFSTYTDLLKRFDFNDITTIYIILIISLLFIFIIILVLHKRIREVEEELDSQKLEQKKLNEKLIIYDRLSRVEAILNGKKK